MQIGMLSHFFISGGALLPTHLCLIFLRVTIFSLGLIIPCSILSHCSILRHLQFIIHYPEGSGWAICRGSDRTIFWWLLVSILVCLLSLSILVVSSPLLNLKHLNHYLHIHTFEMPTITHVLQLIQCYDYAFSIDLTDAYLHIPFVMLHHCFLWFVWQNTPYQWKVLPFGLVTDPRVFTALTEPTLFLCHHKSFWIVIYLGGMLVLVQSKSGQAVHFCVLSWFALDYILIFPYWTFASLKEFLF